MSQIQQFEYKNTQQSLIHQMSSNYQIFDVIQELADQNEEKTHGSLNMTKKNQISSHETLSFLPLLSEENNGTSEDQSQSDGENQKRTKKGRTKIISKDSKWTLQNEKKYWEFFIHYKVTNPYLKISWIKWKNDSIYKEMGKFVNKLPGQCKSKDQNMKKKYLDKSKGLDVLEVALMKLQNFAEKDSQTADLIVKYYQTSEKESMHMRLLDEKMKRINQSGFRFNILSEMFSSSQDMKRILENDMFF